MKQPTSPTPSKKDWLDVLAPVGKGAFRETAGGLFFLAAAALVGGVLILITQPFWEPMRRLPIPYGLMGVVAVILGAWFVTFGFNVLRHTKKN